MTHAVDPVSLIFAVLTVSDTRGPEDDPSGDAIADRLTSSGHRVACRAHVPDAVDGIRRAFDVALQQAQAVVVTGGTGMAARDVTPEALASRFERRLPGFGEAFRRLSFDQVGPHGLLSRADAGSVAGRPVFLLPGSTQACLLAVDRLILPMVGHWAALGLDSPGHSA